ncbi:uncharacterized protein IWZ02DRAFT_217947 [Phyllosticta citriasiana]|uniref:uncharacterized protein n=1 Tax=Phyllosticta citriasiana TaxID=595635 RepID=UPI0030FD45EB
MYHMSQEKHLPISLWPSQTSNYTRAAAQAAAIPISSFKSVTGPPPLISLLISLRSLSLPRAGRPHWRPSPYCKGLTCPTHRAHHLLCCLALAPTCLLSPRVGIRYPPAAPPSLFFPSPASLDLLEALPFHCEQSHNRNSNAAAAADKSGYT